MNELSHSECRSIIKKEWPLLKKMAEANVVYDIYDSTMSKSVLGYVVTLLSGVEDIGNLWKGIFVLNSRLIFSEFNVIRGNLTYGLD
jgi:hypothetical protein